jgi:hypothetical protein
MICKVNGNDHVYTIKGGKWVCKCGDTIDIWSD